MKSVVARTAVFLPFLLLIQVFLVDSARAQTRPPFAPNSMDTILYGVAYYQEYMPYERLEQDVDLMQRAGINVVRLGESNWGLWDVPSCGSTDRGAAEIRSCAKERTLEAR
jgi:hypothetical protein